MRRPRLILWSAALVPVVAISLLFRERIEIAFNVTQQKVRRYSVQDRLAEFGGAARSRWAPFFKTNGVAYPPKRVAVVALKAERLVEIYASEGAQMKLIRRLPILAASGVAGPKLREGDRQVPEGFYQIESLNPNSAYHVSLRLNYPNAADRAQAAKDGRKQLGGDIMIHGKSVSIGCIAVGDEAAEDLFTLAADAGLKNIQVICSPLDFRKQKGAPAGGEWPPWVMELYREMAAALAALPAPAR